MKTLENKVALVTGASAGIGKAIAEAYVKAGAHVIICDLDQKKGEATVQELQEKGGEVMFVKCDVANREEVDKLFDQIEKTYGKLDVACNNAGIEGTSAPVHECTYENWDRVININLTGVFNCMKKELTMMDKQGAGSIVNISSVAGLVGAEGLSPYDSSKHGVIGLSQSAALDYGKKGIRVNAVCPGPIRTEMIERIIEEDPKMGEMIRANSPNDRIGEPEEVAEAVLWLSSEYSSLVTGHALPTDGGWVAK